MTTIVLGPPEYNLYLQRANGSGETCQIMLNNYYQGQAVKYKGEWLFYLNAKSRLDGYEIALLKERLEENENMYLRP